MSRLGLNALKDKVAVFWGTMLFLIIAFLFYTFILSLHNPIIIYNNPEKPFQVTQGSSFQICRGVEYKRRVRVDISRALTHKDGKDIQTISYPTFSILREKGVQIICRHINIPEDIKEGLWTVHTYVTIYTDPFWKKTFELSKFYINVKEK